MYIYIYIPGYRKVSSLYLYICINLIKTRNSRDKNEAIENVYIYIMYYYMILYNIQIHLIEYYKRVFVEVS